MPNLSALSSPLELLPNTYRAFFSGFVALTTAQKQLMRPILKGEDVVLQASTGSGKTEAVLAPATEKLIINQAHFTIIYIVPTRALALDMHRRIKPIYKKLGLKSGIRTGDAKHLRDSTPHLLIMTPESLDVMLGSQNQDNKYFLKHVHMMIIDEVHVFLHDARGQQLAYLRRRLALQSSAALQTIALSATIDDVEDILRFFNLKKNSFVYKQSQARQLQPHWVHIEDEEYELPLFFDDLYHRFSCQKLLVFANSRKKCEQLYELLNQEGFFSKNVFLHYSNLSTQERKFIESSFRDKKIGVCIATSTLELGIDIGDVDGVVLLGPPPSVMAFLQRIGRGNRRQQHSNFWGLCYGEMAEMQLIRFLALFELARENQVEKFLGAENYSVLFQQILSCLYAKKTLSQDALKLLFKEAQATLPGLFQHMIAKSWLKPTNHPGLYQGGWRYFLRLKKNQIWSNFPPTDEEYAVILGQEKIAVLPLSMVKQLEIGDVIQLTGKVLKVLQIEEKKAASEVWVEASEEAPNKDLVWWGFGSPVSLEVAQKMGKILLEKCLPQGLLNRTERLLKSARVQIERTLEQANGIRVHRLGNGTYRYETFLGTVGNYILYHLIETQFSPKIEGLSLRFDEIGIESNEWIPFEQANIPHTIEQFQEWISSHATLLKSGFSWNSWLHCLPENLQSQEISSRLFDPRVAQHFQRYHAEPTWKPIPASVENDKKMTTHHIPLTKEPWVLENEKNAWGKLSFPKIPADTENLSCLTASVVQAYVAQKSCPRWARFQRLGLEIEPHPRFSGIVEEIQDRKKQGLIFKRQVIETLQNTECVRFARSECTWQEAIRMVLLDKKPLFLVQAHLKVDAPADETLKETTSGTPDLIYIEHQGGHICLEVWDIKFSQSLSYAQKWRIAFYTYLLDCLLKGETFLLPVEVSALGGLIYPSMDKAKLFEKTPFVLAPYRTWMPRLIEEWRTNSLVSSAIENYSMELSCTSCRYFSYCYQEVLFKDTMTPDNATIMSRNIESNDFPNNSKHWYFIYSDNESVQWQCWENDVSIFESCLHSRDFPSIDTFRMEVASQLHNRWTQSVQHRKNPHLLVYEARDLIPFQKNFQLTILKSLWAMHVCWTSIQTVLQTHFLWPIPGRLTALQVGACLGLSDCQVQPLSLYHKEPFTDGSFDRVRQIWNWCLSQVKSMRVVYFEGNKVPSVPLIGAYLAMHHREVECRMSDIIEFQKNPLPERVKQFRAIGPISFLGSTAIDKKCFQFSIDDKLPVSKFRVGDFLKLAPIESCDIQDGFSVVLDSYLPDEGMLSLRPLSQKMSLRRHQLYALDEDATDWNAPKIAKVLTLLKDPNFSSEVIQMLLGHIKSPPSDANAWIERWYQSQAPAAGLNPLQKKALGLPFREKIGLIEGPPGTGKTHLLVWTLIALAAHAQSVNRSIKILVTAQTHHAIDNILKKLAKTLPVAKVSDVSLYKYGRFDENQFLKLGIGQIQNSAVLNQHACLILGSTGFGIYQLLKDNNFPKLFDWVIFDEASQILAPYAVLSLIFGKGQALFYGDTQQLSPILKGNYEHTSLVPHSILQELMSRYGAKNRLRLNETYRMNADICKFASQQWYDGELRSVVAKSEERLELPNYPLYKDFLDDCFDPSKSMVVVQLDHLGSQQSSSEEALWIAEAVKRLMGDYSIPSEQIGIISPHRLQNNTLLLAMKEALPFALKLPRVDTVERMQGSEFDIVIFSATVSDKETIHSPFLKEYRRFNVALTRSRKKFIFVASAFFFQAFPKTERALIAQMPFENFFTLTRQSSTHIT